MEALQESLEALLPEHQTAEKAWQTAANQLSACLESISKVSAEKEALKLSIKEWTKAFSESHGGKEPDVKDKAAIKDRFYFPSQGSPIS